MKVKHLILSAIMTSRSLANASTCAIAGDTSIIGHSGVSVGTEKVINGTTMYVTKPPCGAPVTNAAVLYLTDVYGINLTQNRLLADSFARAGFLTVAPDMFNGVPALADVNDLSWNPPAFLARHNTNSTDPIVEKGIRYLRETLGFSKVAISGYCYGGRYAFRFLDPSRKIKADVAFTAHPSGWMNSEVLQIGAAVSVAAGDHDDLLPPPQRIILEGLLSNITSPYQVNLYSGAYHGFGTRANVSDPLQKFAKESSFLQAIRWFESF